MINIRISDIAHISLLAAIEKAAAASYREQDLPTHLRDETVSEQEHLEAQRQGLLVVALEEDITPVGYAINKRVDAFLHLAQIDVHPRYQKRGIGSALLERVFDLARLNQCLAVALTTFCHLPWNAPWYEKNGFRILSEEEMPDFLRRILDQEKEKGLDPRYRVAMQKTL